MSKFSQLASILALPFMVVLIFPIIITLLSDQFQVNWPLPSFIYSFFIIIGLVILGIGILLLSSTIGLFATIGKGTLAPWDPPKHLVVKGPYRHVRNPMISGVLICILGESITLGSLALFIYFVIVFIINHIYFILSEEPNLVKRFGDEYITYSKHVPRWFPRFTPWKQETEK